MTRAAVAFLCLVAIGLFACGGRSHRAARAARHAYGTEARTAALEWLELVDDGEYEAALDREPARLRAAVTSAQFVRSMQGRRAPFGHAISRTLVGSGYSRRLSGAPDGNYESLLFKTTFQHKRLAAERVILVEDHGKWRVVDYRVY